MVAAVCENDINLHLQVEKDGKKQFLFLINITISVIFFTSIYYQTVTRMQIVLHFKIFSIENLGLIIQGIGLLLYIKILVHEDPEN